MASMEMSLDDIIATRPKNDRRPSQPQRGKGRTQIVGTGAVNPATKARAKATLAAKPTPAPAQSSAEKIIVSNLPTDVNEAQVKELFATTVGSLREVTLHYNEQGRSKGQATVVFNRKGDGNRAYAQYNNRLIDGKRPMKIEIVSDPSKAPLASRVGPAPAAANAPATNAAKSASASTRGRGGRRGRGGGGARPKAERKPVTAADLDAEMEDYTATGAAPAAAA